MTDETDQPQTFPDDLGMVCSCNERLTAAQALVDDVTTRLKTDAAHFLTNVAWSLHQTHHVSKWDVICDQWFAIRSTLYGGGSVVIACDELEHGLAALWLYYADGVTPGLDE